MKILNAKTGLSLLLATSLSACLSNPSTHDGHDNHDGAHQHQHGEHKKGHAASERGRDRMMEKYDTNADSVISWQEFDASRRAQFDRTDTSGNQIVDAEEYVFEYEARLDHRIAEERAGQVKQTHVRFGIIDSNDDEAIDAEEYNKIYDNVFARYDTDDNGVVDDADPRPKRYSGSADDSSDNTDTSSDDAEQNNDSENAASNKKKWRRSVIRLPSTHSKKGMLDIYDSNGDGQVERGEFDAEVRARYRVADENGNGTLSSQEYLLEFENRLDAQIARDRKGQIRQTYVRFGVLDANENDEMTFEEFQISGRRQFDRYDSNEDGQISNDDPIESRCNKRH